MDKVINMNELIGAAAGDRQHMLGKFLYFSLTNLLVDKDELSHLCESIGIPYSGSNRLSVSDAFRSATGDIRERIPVTEDGETNIYLAYCRDNKHTPGVLSRELVKETLNRQTNQYEKLANISYNKADSIFRSDNMVYDSAVDVPMCCRHAEELFELYQRCANQHSKPMVQAAYRRIGDWHLAEDLVQETFLTACWKANQICSHSNPTAWLYKTLNNLIMRELHRSYHKDVALDEWNEARESMNLPMHLYLPTGLSEQDKELILLRIDKKLSFDEIAEYYGITNDACRQRLSRAIRKCRSLLDCEK